MDDIVFHTPVSLPPTNGFSHTVTVPPGARWVLTAGQVPMTADGAVAAADWAGQTRLVMENLGIALQAGGATWADVVKLTFYVVDTSELPTVRAVRDEYINAENPPVSSLIRVAGLFRPDVLIEVEAVAAVTS